MPVVGIAQQYGYSIETHQKKRKYKLKIKIKKLFHPNKAERTARKAVKKAEKKRLKREKQYLKTITKYQKHVGKEGDLTPRQKKKVYRRMKKSRKVADRLMHNKHRDPFFVRLKHRLSKKTININRKKE